MQTILRNKPQSILIILLSFIGDIVMASGITPVLHSYLLRPRWIVL